MTEFKRTVDIKLELDMVNVPAELWAEVLAKLIMVAEPHLESYKVEQHCFDYNNSKDY